MLANWLPPDYNKLEITEVDYDAVDVALKHFRRYTLGVIGGQLTGFQEDVFIGCKWRHCRVTQGRTIGLCTRTGTA